MAEDKSNIIFNISGGNNQILPNATKAEQHFYGDQFAKEALRKGAPAETGHFFRQSGRGLKRILGPRGPVRVLCENNVKAAVLS